jgi:glycosyltransferase EpsH
MTSSESLVATPEVAVVEPKLTFIVPIYNVEKYLGKCIGSILNQSLGDFELLLINDGSTDASLEICNRFASTEPRIRVFSQPNRGQALARNKGIGVARGTYISFVDPDDWIHPELVEKLVAVMQSSAADFANFRMAFVAENGGTQLVLPPFTLSSLAGEDILNDALLDKNIYTSSCNKIYRRSFLLQNKLFFPDIRAYEDTYYSRVMSAHAKKCVFLDDVLYYVLIRSGSTSRTIDISNFDMAVRLVAMEKAALDIDQRSAFQRELFDAHVVKFFCYLSFAAAKRVGSWRVFSACLLAADRVGYSAMRRENAVTRHLPLKNKLMAKLSAMPMLLWVLARFLRVARIGAH